MICPGSPNLTYEWRQIKVLWAWVCFYITAYNSLKKSFIILPPLILLLTKNQKSLDHISDVLLTLNDAVTQLVANDRAAFNDVFPCYWPFVRGIMTWKHFPCYWPFVRGIMIWKHFPCYWPFVRGIMTWKHFPCYWPFVMGIMIWKHFPCHWPFVRGIHWLPVDSPHKGPVTCSFNVFLAICLNKWFNKQLLMSWDVMMFVWLHYNGKLCCHWLKDLQQCLNI